MPNYQDTGRSAKGSRTTARIPIVTDEHVNKFSGASVTNDSGHLYNTILERYAGEQDRGYATQRPSITVIDDVSANTPTKSKGRGIHWWSKASSGSGKRYFVNDDTIYDDSSSSAVVVWTNGDTEQTGLTSGTERVYFIEWSSTNDDYLFIINPESDQIFVILASDDDLAYNLKDIIDDGTTGTLGISGTFPSSGDAYDFTNLPITSTGGGTNNLTHGAVALDAYLFLGVKDTARIYNSANDDFLDWSANDFLTVERENDQLLFICKSRDHIVAFGERTTELYYDAANASGSPLTARTDIFYNVGILSGLTAWVDGDDLYFLGMEPHGAFSLYTLKNFELQPISNSTVSSYLRQGRVESGFIPVMSGLNAGNHVYIILTLFDSGGTVPQISLVYDAYSNTLGEWNTGILDLSKFPLVDFTIRTPETPVTAEGIFSNGDVFYISNEFTPVDDTAIGGDPYFLEDYAASDYSDYAGTTVTTNNITMQVLITNLEMLSTDRKFMHSVNYVGNSPDNDQTLTVEWSDDEGENWYSDTINIKDRTQINRLGSFNRRRFKLTYSGDEQMRMEALEATYSEGSS